MQARRRGSNQAARWLGSPPSPPEDRRVLSFPGRSSLLRLLLLLLLPMLLLLLLLMLPGSPSPLQRLWTPPRCTLRHGTRCACSQAVSQPGQRLGPYLHRSRLCTCGSTVRGMPTTCTSSCHCWSLRVNAVPMCCSSHDEWCLLGLRQSVRVNTGSKSSPQMSFR